MKYIRTMRLTFDYLMHHELASRRRAFVAAKVYDDIITEDAKRTVLGIPSIFG
jgi:hypothetical protein